MALILNIETATTVCSVTLSENGRLLFSRELDSGFTHAENLHLFIQGIFKEAGIRPKQLSAVAVSKGPGSYTGLRIGVSTAKGLAYALNIPLISVDTLLVMSLRAQQANAAATFYCPMIDARRMEVYTALYDTELNQQLPIEALIVDEWSISVFKPFGGICFFGDGVAKCREVLSALPGAVFLDGIMPSAINMCELTHTKYLSGDVEDLAYFEPFYLKDFLITKKKS